MVYGFSKAITVVFDLLVVPFGTHRSIALAVLSLLCGVAMIFIFRATSNQPAIKRTRDIFKARILEMRIYQDDLVLIMRAFGGALAANASYLRVSLKPILLLAAFVLLVFIQFDERYGARPIEPGDTTLLTVTLSEGTDVMTVPTSLTPSEGVVLDSAPVRVKDSRQVSWRLRVERAGSLVVAIKAYEGVYELPIASEPGNHTVGRIRTRSTANAFLHPGLPLLPGNAPIASVQLTYPGASYSVFGWHTHWLVVFIIFSFVGALIPKFIFKIQV
jgi:hypothetical protein